MPRIGCMFKLNRLLKSLYPCLTLFLICSIFQICRCVSSSHQSTKIGRTISTYFTALGILRFRLYVCSSIPYSACASVSLILLAPAGARFNCFKKSYVIVAFFIHFWDTVLILKHIPHMPLPELPIAIYTSFNDAWPCLTVQPVLMFTCIEYLLDTILILKHIPDMPLCECF